MPDTLESYPDLPSLLRDRPTHPVYCIFPHVYRETARAFLAGFPGRVLYAVKANAHPTVLGLLAEAGVRHFDCASLPEIAAVHAAAPGAEKYFMIPTRIRDAARAAQAQYGVRHFLVDHPDGLAQLVGEIDTTRAVIFARMAVHHPSAVEDLSARFGAPPAEIPGLLEAIRAAGAEPALAFNVGSFVTDPAAYRHAISVARSVLDRLPFRLRLVDVGGGFPKAYPGTIVPELDEYFTAIRETAAALPLADGAEILCEPGRALAAPGMSAVVEVLLRKGDRLYVNDGMYGIFWELRFKGHDRYPVRVYRDGAVHAGETRPFQVHGPTCDASDTLPGLVPLPEDVRVGDYLEFGNIGAYSLSGRTDFNGYYSERVVAIMGEAERPA